MESRDMHMRRKNVEKKLVASMLCIAMLFGISGCGNNANDIISNEFALLLFRMAGFEKQDSVSNIAKNYVELGKYKGLEVDLKVKKVTDEDVEEEIQNQLEQNSTYEEITDRTFVDYGDIVNINVTAKSDGEVYEEGTYYDYDYFLGTAEFGDDFDSEFIGRNKGESFDITITLPDDYYDDSYAGKEVQFNITINKIEEEIIPTLDDEFVKNISDDCRTVAEYRKYVKKDLQKSADSDNESSAKEDLMSRAVSNAKINGVDDKLYNIYYSQTKNDYTSYAQLYDMEFEDFLSVFLGMDEESFEDYVLDEVYGVQVALAIAKKEGLTVSGKEYKDSLDKYIEKYGWDTSEELESAYSKEYLIDNMTRDKVLDFLFENAKVTEVFDNEDD